MEGKEKVGGLTGACFFAFACAPPSCLPRSEIELSFKSTLQSCSVFLNPSVANHSFLGDCAASCRCLYATLLFCLAFSYLFTHLRSFATSKEPWMQELCPKCPSLSHSMAYLAQGPVWCSKNNCWIVITWLIGHFFPLWEQLAKWYSFHVSRKNLRNYLSTSSQHSQFFLFYFLPKQKALWILLLIKLINMHTENVSDTYKHKNKFKTTQGTIPKRPTTVNISDNTTFKTFHI